MKVGLVNHNHRKQGSPMDNESLAHTKYNCTYHVVFIPKYRRKKMYGELWKDVVEILRRVCEIEGIKLIKGAVCSDHVHM